MPTKNRNLLILGCSLTKDHRAEPMPAELRYIGAYYQMVHQIDRNVWPDIIILSAKLGFIPGSQLIEDYDQKMDKSRAQQLLLDVEQGQILRGLSSGGYTSLFVAAGAMYRGIIKHHLAPGLAAIAVSACGGIGEQRSQLKKWLNMGAKETISSGGSPCEA